MSLSSSTGVPVGFMASGQSFDSGFRVMIRDPNLDVIYIAGGFSSYNGVAAPGLIKLTSDGSIVP